MHFRKMLMRVTWGLAGLLVLVMIGLMVYQNHLRKKAPREISPENQAAGEAVEGVANNDAPGRVGAGQAELIKERIEIQKGILKDPSIQESIRSGLEAQYKPLFEVLSLSSEKQEKLKEILTNSAMAYIELNPEILAAGTEKEKAALQRRYDYLREETQLRVEALLAYDDYVKFQAYEDRSFSRGVVSGFAESLTPGGGVTKDQERGLVETMYVESQKVYAVIGFDPTSRLEFPSDMDPETVSEKMEITNRIFNNSVESSKKILSESQLKTYSDYLRIYSEEVEMSMRMLRQQYGG